MLLSAQCDVFCLLQQYGRKAWNNHGQATGNKRATAVLSYDADASAAADFFSGITDNYQHDGDLHLQHGGHLFCFSAGHKRIRRCWNCFFIDGGNPVYLR
jgi:hypothetical protein